ncbi:MAG TPA: hypothetical protein VI248_25495 [Kineosporiaceae bacterium]
MDSADYEIERVIGGEDALGLVILVLSSHTIPGAKCCVGGDWQVLSGRFVCMVSFGLQLINEGFRVQHQLPLMPVPRHHGTQHQVVGEPAGSEGCGPGRGR